MSRPSAILLAASIAFSGMLTSFMAPGCCVLNVDCGVIIWSVEMDGRRNWVIQLDNADETVLPVIGSNFDSGSQSSLRDFRAFKIMRCTSMWDGKGKEFRLVHISFWPLLLLSLSYPAFLAIRRLALNQLMNRRLHAGLCPHCGYDLRTSPARCPECGASPGSAME